MSYDLYVARKDIPDDCLYDVCDRYGDQHWVDEPRGRYFNYTYNLNQLFSDYHVNPVSDLNGLTGSQCANLIDDALSLMYETGLETLSRKYDPDNGWGSVQGAISWLRSIRNYCLSHPEFVVRERS